MPPDSKRQVKSPRRVSMRERAFILGLLAQHLEEVPGGCRYRGNGTDHSILKLANDKFQAQATNDEEAGDFEPIPISAVQYMRNEVYGTLVAAPIPDPSTERLDRIERVLRFLIDHSDHSADERYELNKILDGAEGF